MPSGLMVSEHVIYRDELAKGWWQAEPNSPLLQVYIESCNALYPIGCPVPQM